MRTRQVVLFLALALAIAAPAAARDEAVVQPAHPHMDIEHTVKAQQLLNQGARFLVSQEKEGGGWSLMGPSDPAITGLVVRALLNHPDYDVKSPIIQRGIKVILANQQEDGGIYNPRIGQQNYTTAIGIMALAATRDPQYKDEIEKAIGYIKKIQIVPGSQSPSGGKVSEGHPFVGGTSYGKHGRPDLSNLGFSSEALHQAGVKPDDPFFQNALVFASNTQNLRETNKLAWVDQIGTNDGGFIYAPALGSDITQPESKAGGGRSYGSMTYTGFKTLLYAGVDKNDPRVKGAYNWIRRYWRLDTNPNMPNAQSKEGLYYYYHVFSKALEAYGQPVITDTKGQKHNWREELVDILAKKVNDNGSWDNDTQRWFEDNPILCTGYVLMALGEVLDK
ncbi:MAG: prenyltransferase/squalene oxidase repeat-containing protein [Phycisphaerae bacterium]